MPTRIIEPTEYYDQEHGGGIPVFRPTAEEFRDFRAFMESIDHYGKQAGIVKIIPPKEWKEKLPDIVPALERARIHNPIIQHIIGHQGIYTQTNIEKRRAYTVDQWFAMTEQEGHRPPDVSIDRTTLKPDMTRRKKRKIAATDEKPVLKKTKRQVEAEEEAIASSPAPVPLSFDPRQCSDPKRYSVEYCKELERAYWRNLTFSQPMYGADMSGTLFDDTVKSWNVGRLDNVLNRLGIDLPGVNTPYLYFGMWKATFPWHVEDMDLYSINYLHFGAPKQWYTVSPPNRRRFEEVMQNVFSQEYQACKEFLRHKTFIASPKLLANCSVPVSRCVQHEGEFIVTFPFGYHAGYNLGLNCAESVNFALDSWIEIGKQAKSCTCISDSVRIDVSALEGTTRKTRSMAT